jgi:uncharacterized protein (DUF2147 family)
MTKKIKKLAALIALFFVVATAFPQASASDLIIGKWLNEDKDAHVEIYKESGKYFGKIVWLREPNEPATGLPKVDDENEDVNLQTRPLLGLVLLQGFSWNADDNEWSDGTIYDPKNGKTYDCYMAMEEQGILKIRGYIGFSWIGRTTYWTYVQ